MPKVPSVAPFCPSAEVVAQQSVTVTTLNPLSQAERMVDSTQQFVRKPQMATVSMPFFLSSSCKSVPGNASKPFLPFTIKSPSAGFMASANSAFHVPSVNSLSLAQPWRMPRFLFGLSEPSSLNMMGACMTLVPFARAALHSSAALLSILFSVMQSFTAGYSLPPSVVNSFWNSMHRKAVLAASILQPPFDLSASKTRVFFLTAVFTTGAALASVDQSAISVVKAAAVMGVENMPKVPSVAPLWPSAEVVAQQSVSVTTL
mmetsp:Transcript_61790/g.113798  ORF Transcript_61790/g.113798 Transcript_61790/m.113798 type:complete len:260 (+) Transcript_61790:216-995(+)